MSTPTAAVPASGPTVEKKPIKFSNLLRMCLPMLALGGMICVMMMMMMVVVVLTVLAIQLAQV